MKLGSGAGKRGMEGWADRGLRGLWSVALVLLGVVLVREVDRSFREGRQVSLGEKAAAREAARLRRENEVLREELRALENDPAYVEALLRRWKKAASGERVVE